MRNTLLAVLVTFLFTASVCNAQDVKYCKNAKTGAIIVVKANLPCPWPTYRT